MSSSRPLPTPLDERDEDEKPDPANPDSSTSQDGSSETDSDKGDSEKANSEQSNSEQSNSENESDAIMRLDRTDESQDFVDKSVMDFDPDYGVYNGTIVHGTSEIEGPHVGDDGKIDEDEAQEFMDKGKEQAKEKGLLDDEGNATSKGEEAKGEGETSETEADE